MLLLSTICLIFILTILFLLATGYRKLGNLGEVDEWTGEDSPLVSIIVPACNEEGGIAPALRSLCEQDYPQIEIIVVNDRSTDRTAEVVETIREDHPAIAVVTIDALPEGWLGKPHALQTGARLASGDYLVFTDADIRMEPTTISRAVRAMHDNSLDHLALVFQNEGGSLLLNTLVSDVGAGLLLLLQPWKARDPQSRFFTGVGAFNMVRSTVYRAIDGHQQIRMQVIDDVFLGKLIKRNRYRQDSLLAPEHITVPWYPSVPAMVDGLMKNVFALFHYKAWLAGLACLLVIVVEIIPVFGAVLADGLPQWLFLAGVFLRLLVTGAGMVYSGLPLLAVPLLLVTPYLNLYIIARAVWKTSRENGITWRGRFYPLTELRKQEWLFAGMFCRSRE
jgi:hypothetical protein